MVQMVLKKLKPGFLKHAKSFCFSEKYSVFCTGRRAFICDRELKLLYTVEKLSYVYRASISPDEKNLLLVSNANIFYLVDLNDFAVKKYTVRGKYNGNLEGRGCWSFDGNSVLLDVENPKTVNSALRRYAMNDGMSYEDLIAERYYLVSIDAIKELNKYLLIGMDREKFNRDEPDEWSMIWFNGDSFEEFPIRHMDISLDVVKHIEYEAATNTVIIYGFPKTFRCDLQGRIIEKIAPVPTEKVEISFSGVFSNLGLEKEDFDSLKSLSALFGMENLSLDDSINKMCTSSDGKKHYIGTNLGLFIVDAETGKLIKKVSIDYGVQDIAEISPGIIVVTTWGGIKVFEIVE